MNIFELTDECRSNFNEYLYKIFDEIKIEKNMSLLDIGCGTGVSSCALMEKYGLDITAVDIDEESLNVLRQKRNDIEVIKGSFDDIKGRKFDIVLAEGLFNIIGFEEGLIRTCDVINIGGYLLIHDDQDDVKYKTKLIDKMGFEIIKMLKLNEDIWEELYIKCLKNKLNMVEGSTERISYDLKLYDENPYAFKSMYYLLRKF